MLTTEEVNGVRVLKEPGKGKIGKVYKTVFSPDGMRVVGFLVKRPDIAFMFKREDEFLALDALDEHDGCFIPTQGKESWGKAAIKRLNLDWDSCIIWEGMDIRTNDGFVMGRVGSMVFNTRTGNVSSLLIDDGITSQTLLGTIEIPASEFLGYRDGYLVVTDKASAYKPSGGAAAKAGEAFAVATKNITVATEKGKVAVKKSGEALEQGSYKVGKQIKKASGMFSAFKEEFNKASKEE